MRRANRVLRLVTGILTVWCLGCDAFELVGESLVHPRASTDTSAADTEMAQPLGDLGIAVARVEDATAEATDVCHCVLGHAAVVSTAPSADRPHCAVADFVDRPPAVPLPAPEPLLRPPVV